MQLSNDKRDIRLMSELRARRDGTEAALSKLDAIAKLWANDRALVAGLKEIKQLLQQNEPVS